MEMKTFWRWTILVCTGVQAGILIHSIHRSHVLKKQIAEAEAKQTFGQVLKDPRGYFWVFINFPDPEDREKIVVDSYAESYFYETEKLAEFAGLSYAVLHDRPVKFKKVLSEEQAQEILDRLSRVNFEKMHRTNDENDIIEVKPI